MQNQANRLIATVISIAAVLTALVIGKPLLLPLAVAIMIWYIIAALAAAIGDIRIGSHYPLQRFSLALALTLIVLLLVGMTDMVGDTVRQVRAAAPGYQENISRIFEHVSTMFGVEVAPALRQFAAQLNVGAAIGQIAAGIMSVAGNAGMVAIYVLFLLIEQQFFRVKLHALFPDGENAHRARSIIDDIQHQIRHYLFLKTLVSAATGLLSFAVLRVVGVDYADFWAFLIFLLNYIPTVGSLLGIAFPTLLALIQFDTLTPFFILAAALGGVQFVIGNLIEPRLMGSSLNLSPLVVILSLSLWGQIWGVVGMFLSVPITVISLIILSHFPATRPFAIMLSENGHIGKRERSEPT